MTRIFLLSTILAISLTCSGVDRKAGIMFSFLILIHEILVTGMSATLYFGSDALCAFLLILAFWTFSYSDYAFRLMAILCISIALDLIGWLMWWHQIPVDIIDSLHLALYLACCILTIGTKYNGTRKDDNMRPVLLAPTDNRYNYRNPIQKEA